MQPIKIALAHDHLWQVGGAERVLGVLSGVYKDAPIFTLVNNSQITKNILDQKNIHVSSLQKIPGILKFFRYFLILMPKIWQKTDLSNFDLVISSSSGFVKGLHCLPGKHICYCHSPIRYLWGSEDKFLKLFLPRILNRLQILDYNAAQRVDYFIANSYFIADKIKKYYDRESTVIHPSVKIDDFCISDKIGNYYLIVSRLRPYKKVDLAIRAFNNLKIPLKIIGSGSEYRRLKKMAKSNIEFLGELSDSDRNQYLGHCRAFIYPQVEDFGITALEAMASGRPVIAYRSGGALETVVEGKSGTFFEDQTWESLAHKILRFDHTKFDPMVIREHARNFEEKVFQNKILDFVSNIK